MTSENEIDQAVAQVLGSGLASENEQAILRQLDAELQQQAEAQAMVLSGEEPAPWVLGGESGGGFGSMAQRFLNFYADALYREICDPQQGRMKDEYRSLVSGSDTRDRVKAIVPAVLTAIGVGASLVNPAAIAAIVALWLVKLGLDQWCALPRPSATAGSGTNAATASGTGTPETGTV